VEYLRLCRPEGDLSIKLSVRPILMAEFVQQLLTTRPKEAAGTFARRVALLEELLQEAAGSGAVRDDFRNGRIIGAMLEVVMFNAFALTIGGPSARHDDADSAEELWRFLLKGIRNGVTLPR